MQWNRASHCELVGKSVETETITWWEFHNGGKAIVEQILVSEEVNKNETISSNKTLKFVASEKLKT